MTVSLKICFITFKLLFVSQLFKNYEKCPNFLKFTKYALIILSKITKMAQIDSNFPKFTQMS